MVAVHGDEGISRHLGPTTVGSNHQARLILPSSTLKHRLLRNLLRGGKRQFFVSPNKSLSRKKSFFFLIFCI